jgi:phosphoribosylglycinamide formyltransferase-1
MVDDLSARLPIAVLASGGGSNLQALIDACAAPEFGAAITVVIADRAGIRALDRASAAEIPARVVPWRDYASRDEFTIAVCDVAAAAAAQVLVLAGFMRVLSGAAMERFPDRILNTHPSLLPAFPGAHAVEDALAYGVKCTGMTIHFVDEKVDHGPIVYQEAVVVGPDDNVASVTARIQAAEHRAYPQVVGALAAGKLRVEGRIVYWEKTP